MNTRSFALSTLAAAIVTLVAACSSVPVNNAALDQARSRYDAAQRDPQVSTLAPEELKRAAESLRFADQAWSGGGKPSTVDHLAYLASQRVAIAQDTASSKASQAVTAGAGAERDKMRLALRTREADRAQAALAQSQQSNAQKSSELAAADSKLAARSNEIDAAQAALSQSQQANAQKSTELALAEAAAQADKARLERRDARLSDLEMQLKALNAKKTERGMVVTLGDVLFDSGRAQLTSDSSGNLGKLAAFFQRNPQRSASIEGYTDSVGSASSNLDLSGRRAGAVKTALVGLGVPAERLSTQAHGEEMPAASNDTLAGRQMNRRVEIVFAPQADDVVTK
jgi:outer membrane protein OmpA-like peptidoglycan-associated protein